MYDTGSTDLILPQKNCKTCGNHTEFNPDKSTSFSPLPGLSITPEFNTAATTLPISGLATANCTVVTDTVALHGLISPDQIFAICNAFPQDFDNAPMDGILGMGIAPQSNSTLPAFWSWYYTGQIPEPVFSFYMAPGSLHGGELTLGGVDESKYTGDITYVDLNADLSVLSEAFVMDLQTLYINDKEVLSSSYNSSTATSDRNTGRTAGARAGSRAGQPFPRGLAALDTGTAFLQTPDNNSAIDIYAQISPLITQIDPAGAWGAPCEILDAIAPEIKFAIGSGSGSFNMTLPPTFFNLGEYPGSPGICQAPFNSPVVTIDDPEGEGRPVWILGSPVLKAYYTVWDGLGLRVGFAEAGGEGELSL
ncbi:aspartic peptidase domain-containing protein [Aspergillus californicus]